MIKVYVFLHLIIFSACSTHITEVKHSKQSVTNTSDNALPSYNCFIDPISIKKIEGNDLQFLDKNYYQLVYSNKHLQPYLVTWFVEEKGFPRFKRGKDYSNHFDEDYEVQLKALNNYYVGSGWDKGHMAPNGDFSYSIKAARSTFVLSNVSPQEPSFNQHKKWKALEDYTRKFSCGNNTKVQVLAGPILHDSLPTLHDLKSTPSIPKYFYKILIAKDHNECRAISFVFNNSKDDGTRNFFDNKVPLKNVQEVTAILDKAINYDEDDNFWKKTDGKCGENIHTDKVLENNNNYLSPEVKKSKNGKCHQINTTYYSRTKSFIPYNSIQDCLKSGGELPER